MNRFINIKTFEGEDLLFSEQTTCSLEDDYLSYSNETDNITINLDKFSFKKENNETIFKLNYQECTLTLKELNNSLNIPIDYINYENDHNKNIEIKYKIASTEKPITIKIEIGETNYEI